jgi:formylmethanofuran dehydrogenase subunit A
MSRPVEPATPEQLAERIRQALGLYPADLVIKNARILDIVGGQLSTGDTAINGGHIVGVYESYAGRREIDGRGLVAVPGFIDAHVHIESSLVTPDEFDRNVLLRGTTAVSAIRMRSATFWVLPASSSSSTALSALPWTCGCSSRAVCRPPTSRRPARAWTPSS